MAIASKPPKSETRQRFSATAGVVGVDINADHLAVAETDRFGNLLAQFSVPCITDGKSVDQRLEAVRLAAKAVVEHAARVGKPIVHEELDFRVRKQALRESDGPRYARMLSSFAYGSLLQALQSCALRHQVPTHAVNPAYTSVIGWIKYAKRLGVSTHQAAALTIGRRGVGFREHAPNCSVIPDGKGDHLVFELPAKESRKA
jgi:IS605 OrfB family transposase